jgi:S-adenosylmethionine-diacylglycerol 3-amino-3-carboxypropyl transferase
MYMFLESKINSIRDYLFSSVHKNNLIYNCCWEDPACDRELLNINSDSKIVMITSAGCNALEYLLDNPMELNAIDMNYRQNALLHLKLSLFRNADFDKLFSMFGKGMYFSSTSLYHKQLRADLPEYAQTFWDANIEYFIGHKNNRSFYFRGTSGQFAWYFNKYLNGKKNGNKLANDLLNAQSLEEQKELYPQLESLIFSPMIKWMMNRHVVMSMLGVPRAQRQLIIDGYPGGISAFLLNSIKHVFTELPIHNNYFWRVYINGSYTRECCPAYLKEEFFEQIKERVNNIHVHTTSLTQFLKNNPSQYTHFVLLDHQDWLSHNNPKALEEEWKYILKNAKSGTRILLRSASLQVNFIPSFVLPHIEIEHEFANSIHQKDRVGTYGCTFLAIVK